MFVPRERSLRGMEREGNWRVLLVTPLEFVSALRFAMQGEAYRA